MKNYVLGAVAACVSVGAMAEQTPIEGVVESKCVITTDTAGVYGNPVPYSLSTDPADGGVTPIVRYDVISGEYYKASIEYPINFTTSPSLDDVVNFVGAVSTSEVSDALMSEYDVNKVEFNNVTEFDLIYPGSVWFKIDSEATYGFNKSFPAGSYNAVVNAECIAI